MSYKTLLKRCSIGAIAVATVALIFRSALATETLPVVDEPILGYGAYGQGSEHVLVFHDWMGDSDNYEPILRFLDPSTFTYVFADVRGYGRSRHLSGEYSVSEIAGDAFRLADHLGWKRFHVVGHSMTGMAVQRMAVDDWTSGRRRLKSIVTITPVTADGYPADEQTKQFLWDVIRDRQLSEQGFFLLTGQRLLPAWGREKTTRHFATSSEEALRGYYRMWLETDFSEEIKRARVGTPIRLIGGRQDLPGFQEEKYRATFGVWYSNLEMHFIEDSGHYPMQETPVYLATLLEEFLRQHP